MVLPAVLDGAPRGRIAAWKRSRPPGGVHHTLACGSALANTRVLRAKGSTGTHDLLKVPKVPTAANFLQRCALVLSPWFVESLSPHPERAHIPAISSARYLQRSRGQPLRIALLELRKVEVRRTPLLRPWLNKDVYSLSRAMAWSTIRPKSSLGSRGNPLPRSSNVSRTLPIQPCKTCYCHPRPPSVVSVYQVSW
jgi:hypothetical protein